MTLQVFLYTFLQGDENHDNWIFALATLLSSTLVYNAFGAITDDSLSKLKYPFIAKNIHRIFVYQNMSA